MFSTPPQKMVITRSTSKRQEKEKEKNSQLEDLNQEQKLTEKAAQPEEKSKTDAEQQKNQKKSENVLTFPSTSKVQEGTEKAKTASKPKSKASALSSVLARKKKLELEAAQAKARIQMELIDKKLAADMAELDEIYSSRLSEGSEVTTHSEVEKWIDRSQQELKGQSCPRYGNNTGKACPPLQPVPDVDVGREASVSLLVNAIKDLTAATASAATKGSDAKMLSRLCTPRDLPSFSGDPLDWLQFKQAYEESTLVCNFNERENMWRLRKSLHGQAKEAVMSLLISATTPDIVISTLDLQYGNPDIIISKIMQDIISLKPLPEQYHKDIIPFSVKVKNYVAAVLAIGQYEYLSAMNIMSMVLSKLPTILISENAGVMTSDRDRCLLDLQEKVRRSFSIESMGISCKPRKNADHERAIEHLERTSSLIDGRWYVGLPWKDPNCVMSESYPNAERTNLRGADNELRKPVQELDENVLKNEAVNYGTTWTFIPPASPHWGGAWERLIRSVKVSLHSTLKERAPRDEMLSTLMAEVEQMVNSRPLTHVSVEPNTNESLTPNHFLLGSSSNLPIIGQFAECDMYLRKQWRATQSLADLYWRRWVKEVLPEMRPRRKWLHEERPLQIGDLVLIVDPDSPRNVWPKGLIHDVRPGKDGRIRVVDVKTKSGVLRRSAARVARIPTGDEC